MVSKFKKTVKRKPQRKTFKGKVKKSKNFASSKMVSYLNPRSMLPFPQRYRCIVSNELVGYWNSGYSNNFFDDNTPAVFTAAPFIVQHNSPFNIYTQNSPLLTGTTPTVTILGAATLGAIDSTGWAQLSTIYGRYRVYNASINVTIQPESIVDVINVVVIPTSGVAGGPIGPSQLQDYNLVASQPFARTKMIQCNTGNNTIKHSISQHKLFGVSKQSIEDDLSFNFSGVNNSTPPQYESLYQIFWQTTDNQNTVNNVGFRIKMQYHIEMWNPLQGLSIT